MEKVTLTCRGELSDVDIAQALAYCLQDGTVDINMYLKSNLHADCIRMRIKEIVRERTADPIEILTFHWGFRLMRLRPTRPLSELYAEAELAKAGHRLDLLPHHKTAKEKCPKCQE